MSEFMDTQRQGSVFVSLAHSTTENMEKSLGGAVCNWPRPSRDAELWSAGPISHEAAVLRRASPEPHPGSIVELALEAGVLVSQPEGMSVGELTAPLICPGVARMQRQCPFSPLHFCQWGKLPSESSTQES